MAAGDGGVLAGSPQASPGAAHGVPGPRLDAEVVAGLLAELPAERGQDRRASGARPAVDELPAAGAFEQDHLVVEGGKRVKPGNATPRRR
jgi:hypothetical protein